ncbi:hypothetical protein L6164_024188 [Bauhinia variegata]|uniref:Uncharacterized protein n=1 Tax=Bauhinia variegata TaxID=167791 RepID=A0ACB9LWI0_BAUVA|nr:hypothetical protein L6164_024188 [Bauhinia variegata]
MKRKDVEELFQDFSSISLSHSPRKSRRLDPDLFMIMDEDLVVSSTHDFPQGLSQEQPGTNSGREHSEDAESLDTVPMSNASEERALVLYDPANTPFLKSPSSPEFSITVKANLIPGLKDYLLWRFTRSECTVEEEKEIKEKKCEASNDCSAVVPWIAFHSPTMYLDKSPATGQQYLQQEEVELMDMDGSYVRNWDDEKPMEIVDKVEAAGESSQWQQQYCMIPNILQRKNTFTPLSW